MSIARVGIVGSGIMGSGIAETAAVNGFEVILRSRSQSTADATLAALEKSLNRQVEKGKKTEAERDAALALVTGTSDLAALKDLTEGRTVESLGTDGCPSGALPAAELQALGKEVGLDDSRAIEVALRLLTNLAAEVWT